MLAAPNVLGMINSNRVKKGLVDLAGAIKEAQSQATRKSDSCTITIDTADKEITGPCLLSTRNLNENLDIRTNIVNNSTAIITIFPFPAKALLAMPERFLEFICPTGQLSRAVLLLIVS